MINKAILEKNIFIGRNWNNVIYMIVQFLEKTHNTTSTQNVPQIVLFKLTINILE